MIVDTPAAVGLVVVDHGSRRVESNLAHEQSVRAWEPARPYVAVEPAHMELAEPSIADAFARCVDQGATTVIVAPYFLGPGRHWDRDIPALAAQAAADHPGVRWLVSAPLGPDPRLLDLLEERVGVCTARAAGEPVTCDRCDGDRCRLT
jgi:sirohydrochlorin ferrochelatase